jgi:nitrogen fixation NifU-like protein
MYDLRALYQEVIIDHNRHPRNHHRPEGANRLAEGYNPLCGDHLTVYLKMADGVIQDVGFEGNGCAISTASASLMTEHLKGKTEEEARTVFEQFHEMVTEDNYQGDISLLGKLKVFGGVREFPARVKCATLCWHTLHSALKDEHTIVSTE